MLKLLVTIFCGQLFAESTVTTPVLNVVSNYSIGKAKYEIFQLGLPYTLRAKGDLFGVRTVMDFSNFTGFNTGTGSFSLASKGYADAISNSAYGAYVKKSGDTMTGTLTMNDNTITQLKVPTNATDAVRYDTLTGYIQTNDMVGVAGQGGYLWSADYSGTNLSFNTTYIDDATNSVTIYANSISNAAYGSYVKKSGDTMSGTLQLLASKMFFADGYMGEDNGMYLLPTSDINTLVLTNFTAQELINIQTASPRFPSHAATKEYVDARTNIVSGYTGATVIQAGTTLFITNGLIGGVLQP